MSIGVERDALAHVGLLAFVAEIEPVALVENQHRHDRTVKQETLAAKYIIIGIATTQTALDGGKIVEADDGAQGIVGETQVCTMEIEDRKQGTTGLPLDDRVGHSSWQGELAMAEDIVKIEDGRVPMDHTRFELHLLIWLIDREIGQPAGQRAGTCHANLCSIGLTIGGIGELIITGILQIAGIAEAPASVLYTQREGCKVGSEGAGQIPIRIDQQPLAIRDLDPGTYLIEIQRAKESLLRERHIVSISTFDIGAVDPILESLPLRACLEIE